MERLAFLVLSFVSAFAQSTVSRPGQPAKAGAPGQFEIVGDSLVSAQQMFLGTLDKVYIVDKTENNPAQIAGHPAWASEFSVSLNEGRTMDAITNTFCAGGNVLGNGTWLNVGGNQAVQYGGEPAESQFGGGPYNDPDGRNSIRLLDACDDERCDWVLAPRDMTTRRWYPTLETLEDGTVIILGGCQNGGYVNDAGQDNPTYEFFPPRGDPILSPILQSTLPVNLYPLTWLLPSGKLLLQSNWDTVLLDYHTNDETKLDNMKDAVRTYPASAGTIMLPLTPKNNYTATVLFCGGTNLQSNQWTIDWNIAKYPASDSCVSITPDISPSYDQEDPLPEGRTMGNLLILPDGKLLMLNGAKTGTAGYGNASWAIGMSYADDPILQPVMYDPQAPAGSRWSTEGLSASTVPRMYHSSATVLPDGAVLVSGSNPNSDYNVGPNVPYGTEYRVEKFYPPYYNNRRPQPEGLISKLSYGGDYFDVSLDEEDLFGDVENVKNATVVLLRTGFSTHALNMGQRYLQLDSTYTAFESNNTAVLHVSQLPPNPAIFAPGPCLLFVIVDGTPSLGIQVMVGSGELGEQDIQGVQELPESSIAASEGQNEGDSNSSNDNGAAGLLATRFSLIGLFFLTMWSIL